MLAIRKTMAAKGWRLNWNARASNLLAETLAKKSLAFSCSFSFSSSNLSNISVDFENVMLVDMAKIHSFL